MDNIYAIDKDYDYAKQVNNVSTTQNILFREDFNYEFNN
jgi:hypothetical protein